MKRNHLLLIVLLGVSLFASLPIQAGRGGAVAGGFFAGVLTGAVIAGAASSYDDGCCDEELQVYYDSPVYEAYWPESTNYGVYDYPTYKYYPGYAYSVDIPVYMYPAGYYYAY